MLKPFALILSALLLAMTSYVQASTTEAAEAAALAWLEAIDQGEYEQAWEKSSPLLKTPLSPTMLQRVVTLARNDLGSVESRRRIRHRNVERAVDAQQHGREHPDIGDDAGDEAERIHGAGLRLDAGEAERPECRLEAERAAIGRRAND